MGTRSLIGKQLSDGSILGVYCHWDGYVENNGRILVNHYQDREAVKDLIDGGSMSSLRTTHTWESGIMKDDDNNYILDENGQTQYTHTRDAQPLYHTERGEELNVEHTSFDEFVSGDLGGEEYAYLFDLNGNWKAYKIGWREEPTERVSIPGYVTA